MNKAEQKLRLMELIDSMLPHEGESFEAALAEHLLANGVTVSVQCRDCKCFMEYTEEYKQTVEGADGDCYLRMMHSEDKQYCARKSNDFCSDGKRRCSL